jgi:tetrahydromethanopterin S-methyltransferase subunit B
MDLESPFLKIAVVRGATGALEEREVTKAKIIGDKIELSKSQGGVAVFPISDVAGLLPKFPDVGVVYELKDVNEAIRFLEALPEELKQRPDASTAALQKWKDLKKPMEEAEKKRKQEDAEAVAQKAIEEKKAAEEKLKAELDRLTSWLKEAVDFQKPRSEEELEKLRLEGQNFFRNKTGDTAKVYDCLAVLSQVLPKEKGGPLPDLAKLNEVQPKIVPDDFLVWVTAGILIVSFFGLLMGLSFTSSGVTRLREGAVLGGVVFGGLGLAILAGLAAIWWPMSGDGENISCTISPTMERTVIFAKNSIKTVYYLPSSESKATGLEFASSLLASLSPSDESSGMFKGKLKEGTLWIKADAWMWKQPVTALGIPIPVSFMFQGKMPKATEWTDVAIERVSLGRLTLPVSVGSILCEGMKSTMQSGLSSGGFASIKATQMDDGQLLISTQASGTKPKVEIKEEEKEVVKEVKPDATEAVYRKMITAEDLAKAFAENKGGEFSGKFVVVDGVVEKIYSGSEFAGSGVATTGDLSNKSKKDVKISGDRFDIFYLKGMNSYGYRKDPLYIKVIVKSPYVFVMDNYGDIYKGPNANIVKEKAFIKKGYRVKFLKEGRVQSDQIKNNEIEVYGVEIDVDEDIQCFDPSAPPPK